MRVGGIADAIELQIGVAQSGFNGLLRELKALGEFDSVGCGLQLLYPTLRALTDGIEEVGRERRLAAGELHRHLPTRLDGDGVVEHGLDFFPR